MSDVLINFVGKTDELQPAENALDALIAKEGEVGQAWKKTGDAMAASAKQSNTETNKLAKSIDQMAIAAKSMDKAVIGGAYKQYLKEIQAQLGLTNKELISYIQNARKGAQESVLRAGSDQEIKDLTISIEVMNEQLQLLGGAEGGTEKATVSLRAQIRQAKEELVAMAEAGLAGTPAFNELQQKAGQLDDQMRDLNATVKGLGSDTKSLDGLISLASGVAGGFAVAQGAAALFGSENKDVQQALLKVNAAMAILQGLQQIQNVLQKESAAMLFLSGVRTKALAIGQQFLAATTLESAAATGVLRAALIASGIGVFVVLLASLASAMDVFSSSTESAEDKTKRLTEESEKLYEALQKIRNTTQTGVDRQVEIIKSKELVNVLSAEEAGIAAINAEKKRGLGLEKDDLQLQLYNLKAAQEVAEDKTQFTERELQLKGAIYSNDKAQLLLDIETNKVLRERALKSESGAADAEIAKRKLIILQQQVDSIESIKAVNDAEINAIKKKTAVDLNNAQLTLGERQRIIAESNLKIAEQQKAFDVKLLEFDKAGIAAKLLLVENGSEKEFNLKIDQLQKEREIELSGTELSQQKITEIKANYRAKELALIKEFEQQKIQNEIFYLNSYLDEFNLSEDRKLELTIRRLDRQRDLEISQANGNAAKIKEINARTDKEILDAKRASIKAITDLQLQTLKSFQAAEEAQYARTIESEKSSLQQKITASNQLLANELFNLDIEKIGLDKQLKAKTISQEDYNLKLNDIFFRRSEAEIAAEKRVTAATLAELSKRAAALQSVLNVFQKGLSAVLGTTGLSTALAEITNFGVAAADVFEKVKAGAMTNIEAIKAIAAAAVASAQAVINQVFSDASAQRQQIAADEISALEEQKQKELSVANLTNQQKKDIEDRYRAEERRIKIQAFNADKEAKKSQALINAALGATLAFAEYPWPASLVVAGIIAGLAGIEIAEINRQQPPRFRHGKVDIEGPGTETSDSIPAFLSKRESVINAPATKKWKGALEAMNADTFENYLVSNLKHLVFPHVPEYIQPTAAGLVIDYNLLARTMANEIGAVLPPAVQLHNSIDGDGLHSFIQEGSSRTEILNKRYSMS